MSVGRGDCDDAAFEWSVGVVQAPAELRHAGRCVARHRELHRVGDMAVRADRAHAVAVEREGATNDQAGRIDALAVAGTRCELDRRGGAVAQRDRVHELATGADGLRELHARQQRCGSPWRRCQRRVAGGESEAADEQTADVADPHVRGSIYRASARDSDVQTSVDDRFVRTAVAGAAGGETEEATATSAYVCGNKVEEREPLTTSAKQRATAVFGYASDGREAAQ